MGFTTFMTGEIFALLRGQSMLRHSIDDGWDETEFLAGVDAMAADASRFGSQLFELRAHDLVIAKKEGRVISRMSGLTIGAEIAAMRARIAADQPVALIGASVLSQNYQTGLGRLGVGASICDVEEMTLAGLAEARLNLGENA